MGLSQILPNNRYQLYCPCFYQILINVGLKFYIFRTYTSYSVSVGVPTMQETFVCLDLHLGGLTMTR